MRPRIVFGRGSAGRGAGLFAALLTAPSICVAEAPVRAADQDSALARCIWEKVPTSALNWLQLGKLKKGRNYASGTRGHALQFRLMAACNHRDRVEAGTLYAALVALKPAAAGPDSIVPKAARCEMFFEDDSAMERTAGVDWVFGDDSATPPITERPMFGRQLTSAEMNALMTGKKIGQTLQRLEAVASAGVRTYAEGTASGEPFVLGRGMGLKRCQIVQADGSLTAHTGAEAAK